MDREFYQWLQTLVLALQLPEWPYSFSRQNATVLIANSLDLNPNDPELLSKVLVKLDQILAGKEEIETIPSNLADLVRDYEEHLAEIRENSLREVFDVPTVDETIRKLYQDYRQKIQSQLIDPEEKLKANSFLQEELGHQITINLIQALPQTAREKGPASLSKEEYQETVEQLIPLISQEFKWAGVEEPKIETDENVIETTAAATIDEAKKVAFTGRKTVPVKKLLAPLEKPVVEKPAERAEEVTKAVSPKLTDLPFLKWRPSGVGISPFRTSLAFSKRAILSPFVKPLQWLIDLAPESFREKNLGLVFAAHGITPQSVDTTLKYLYKEKPESPEIPYWQSLKAILKSERPPFTTLFEHYHELPRLGRAWTKIETLGTSRLAKIITFGRFDNFPSLRAAFWRVFKSSRIGGWISRGAGKIISYLPKITKLLSMVGAAVAGWETFKKAGKVFLGFLAYLFMVAAHYGPAAVGGLLTGLAVGLPFAGKAAAATFAAVTTGLSFLGPLAPVVGTVSAVVVFFVVEAIFAVAGLLGGIGLQMLIDKISAGLGGISLPQAGTTGFTQAGAAAASTAKWFVPAAVGTATVGGLIVSQIVSSAFVIPSEEVRITSPYIEVTKTVEFSGNIGDPIRYTIRVAAVDKDLTNVQITDQPTATCRGTPPDLEEHSWNGSISIPAGETWERTYKVATNDQFNDCLISNTVRITALVEGKTEESFSVGYVSIGNPPEVIPQGLPIHDNPARGNGYTFGQMVPCYTDPSKLCPHQGIDVHGPPGAAVYSTFTGESKVADLGYSARGGYYIILSAGKYQIYMGHLAQRPSFRINDPVGAQAPVGKQGDSGHAFGEHVHYQIWENGIIVDPRRFGVPSPPW